MSELDEEESNKVEQWPVRMNMADHPIDELHRAVGKIKTGKVAGKFGILPDMIVVMMFS